MRDRLQHYRHLEREIDNAISRLEWLQIKATSPPCANLSGTPRKALSTGDTLSYRVSHIVDLETEIMQLIEKRDEERRFIESVVKQLEKPDERAVIRLKYIDGVDWNEIIMLLYGHSDDFDLNTDRYKQRVYRLHRTAIEKLSEIA